jgi:hypothetical protein
MPIISINEKRTADLPHKTTGKERAFHTADQFAPIDLVDAKITGKLYFWAGEPGGFGAFWENSDGTLVNLEHEISGLSNFTERTTQIHANATSAWKSFEIDLSGNSIDNGRLVLYARKTGNTNHYQTDVDYDDIVLTTRQDTTVTFDVNLDSVFDNNLWQRSAGTEAITSYSNAKSLYSNETFENLGTSTNQLWNSTTGEGGTSSGTGSNAASDSSSDTRYLYYEATGSAAASGAYLRWTSYYNITTGSTI